MSTRTLIAALAGWGAEVGARLGARVAPQAPGWCSWYCHGPQVTAGDIATATDASCALISATCLPSAHS
mgnify:CR=1 FL=1